MSHSATYDLTATTIHFAADIGRPDWDEAFEEAGTPRGLYAIFNGNEAGQANDLYRGNDTGVLVIPAMGSLTIDFKGSNGEKNAINNPLSFVKIKWIFIQYLTFGPGNSVTIGPDGNSSNANLGFKASGNFALQDLTILGGRGDGWVIVAGKSNMTFKNPTATDQIIRPRIHGVNG